jgi:hypothetical protein
MNRKVDEWRENSNLLTPMPGTIPHLIELYKISDEYLELADSTKRTYESDLRTLQRWSARDGRGHLPARDITRKAVKALYKSLRWPIRPRCKHGRTCPVDRVCPVTNERCPPDHGRKAKGTIYVLSLLMQVGMDEGYVRRNPCRGLKLRGTRPRRVVWPDEAVDALCRTAVDMNLRSIALAVRAAADLGQREGDILILRREQLQNGGFLIPPQKTRHSSGKPILIPVLPSLRAWLEKTGGASGPWIVSESTGRPYAADHFQSCFARVRSRAGLKAIAEKHGIDRNLEFRDLRRTAVVHLGRAGCTVPEIAAITGHSLTVTQAILEDYLPRDSEMAAAAMKKLKRYRDRHCARPPDAPPSSTTGPRRNPARELADQLVHAKRPDGRGGTRVWTRAEIEAEVRTRLNVSRNVAQSAATKAVQKNDRDNPERRTHRAPVARAVDDAFRERMRDLAASGLGNTAIAREIGADPRTVRIHLRR